MSNVFTKNKYDPITGKILYKYTADGEFLYSWTGYDIYNQHSWQSHTVKNEVYGWGWEVRANETMIKDDGSKIHINNEYWGSLANYPHHYLTEISKFDPQGRLTYVEEKWDSMLGYYEISEIKNVLYKYEVNTGSFYYKKIEYYAGHSEAFTYDKSNGNLDYVLKTAADGRLVAEDYNPNTALLDYVITKDSTGYRLVEDYDAKGRIDYVIEKTADGKQIARDYNPETGLLDYVITRDEQGFMLAEDYDSLGRLDYVIEKRADGRMIAIDYDLADEHSWVTYTIAYNSAGQIESAIGL